MDLIFTYVFTCWREVYHKGSEDLNLKRNQMNAHLFAFLDLKGKCDSDP